MVALHSEEINDPERTPNNLTPTARERIAIAPGAPKRKGWKSTLNYLRLLLQPLYYFNLLKPLLSDILAPKFLRAFYRLFYKLIDKMNTPLEQVFPRGSYLSFA
jgi:hypothetical protein